MMQQYDRIKAAHTDSLVFFRLGDFYEMFRQDALDASRILGLTLTARNGTPMCGIPHHAVKMYIPRLLAAGRKIALCDQTTLPQAGKGIVERQVVQIISPGTLVDEEYLDQSANNFLLSLSRLPHCADLGAALFDLSTGELSVQILAQAELSQDLEALMAKWQPREILLQESLLEDNPVVQVFLRDFPDLVANRFGDWLYDIGATQEQLCRLIGVLSLKAFGLIDQDPLLNPISAILHYGENATRHSLDQVRGLTVIRQDLTLQLDETSVKNLELVRNLHDSTRNFSLLAVLDHTRTPMGARFMRRRILEPLQDRPSIEHRLAEVDALYRQQSTLNRLRDLLSAIADVQRLVNRIALDKAHPKELVALARSVQRMLKIASIIAELGNDTPLVQIFESIGSQQLQAAAQEILATLEDEPSVMLSEGNIIRSGYDQKVDEYRSLRDNSAKILDEYVEAEKLRTGITSLRVRSNNIIGYYLEVTKSNIAAVPAHFRRKQSLVGGERFTTDRLLELEEAINHATELCIDRERTLFLQLRQALKPLIDPCLALSAAIARLDVAAGLAWAATAKGYTRPEIHEDSRLEIKSGRHPVVEEYLGQGTFIPNDAYLASANQPASTALITGPNMAGKSTYLRQTALIVLMAHIGSFVPAESAQIGLVDRIFCRVGASDNLARGESTFLVEMNETAYILRSASQRSLVIMDEVGRGTSTQDGLSIAQAILEYLLQSVRCRCLFATHFHELTAVADTALCNLSMVVDDQNGRITFLKKVRSGPSNNSYGIHVARLAGLPDSVIDRAEIILAGLPDQVISTHSVPLPLPAIQASLFTLQDQIETELRNFKIEHSTPLQALALVDRWKNLFASQKT